MMRCHLARRMPECFCPHSQINSNAWGDEESSPLKVPVALEIQLLIQTPEIRRQLTTRVLVYSSMLAPTSTEFYARVILAETGSWADYHRPLSCMLLDSSCSL